MNSVEVMSRRVLDRVWRGRFARNVAMVAAGTAGAQIISIAFTPVITRVYGPEAFGLLGAFMAIVALATPLAALAYPIAIVLPTNDRDALGLARLSVILSSAIALFALACVSLVGDWLTDTLRLESVAGYVFLVPPAMLFAAWLEIAQQWLIRKKEFGVLARTAVANSLILNSAKAGIGWLHPVGAVLIVVATMGNAIYATLLIIGARKRYKGSAVSRQKVGGDSTTTLARRYRDFPLYRAPQNFINAVSQTLPVLMLATFFGPAAAGFYTLGKMLMGLPSALVGKAVTDVFYPSITEAARNGENIARQIVLSTAVLLIIGIVPFGFVMLFGPRVFSFVFGDQWAMAGEYARWLAIFFLFNFINKPSVAAVPVLGIQRGLLFYELFSTGGKILGLVLGFYWFHSDLLAVALFSIMGVIAYCSMMLWILAHAMRWRADAQAG